MKSRRKSNTSKKERVPSTKPARKSRRSDAVNGDEVEYDYAPSHQAAASPLVQLMQANNPPLSNYEQKQIVEALLNHPQEKTLTFDEAQAYANSKALAISKLHRIGLVRSHACVLQSTRITTTE